MDIRLATMQDLDRLMEIETLTFPAAEMAKREHFAYRLRHFGAWFFTAWESGQILGLACSRPTAQALVTDELYEPEPLRAGKTLAVLSLETDPGRQREGIAAALLEHTIAQARAADMETLILACKDPLVHYYRKFGFGHVGTSASTHGGARWNDMRLIL